MVKYKTFKFYFNNTEGKVHASLVIFVLQGWKWTVSCCSRFSPEKSPLDIVDRKMVSLRDGLHEAAKAKFLALPSIEPCSTNS
jgi:hypothetical protein